MFLGRETGDVEDVCRRGRRVGVDYAVCRDDRGLGAAHSAALKLATFVEKPDGRRQACVPRGLRKAQAPPLRLRVGAFQGHLRSLKA